MKVLSVVLRSSRQIPFFFALSCVCVVMFLVRVSLVGRPTFVFLLWNLFLAWVPFILSLAFEDEKLMRQNSFFLWILGIGWLLFFPNAPYILTDVIHLTPRPPVPYGFDVALVAITAITGLLLGLASLWRMERIILHRSGTMKSQLFVVAACLLGGFGIFLGRVQRWNSWDVFFQPHQLLPDVVLVLFQWDALTLTIFFAACIFVAEWIFRHIAQRL